MAIFKQTLKFGSIGSDVGKLQSLLNKNGATLYIDNQFGKATLEAVKQFQKDYGLKTDGIVGNQTQSVLEEIDNRVYSMKWYNKYALVISIPKKDLETFDIIDSKGKFETLESMYKRLPKKPDLLFNGTLYDMLTGVTLAKVIDEGKKTGVGYYSQYGLKVTFDGKISFTKDVTNAKEFIGFSPALISNSSPLSERKDLGDDFYYGRHPRTSIGQNDTHYFLVFIHGRRKLLGHIGMSIPELRDFMYNKLGCTDAGNVDGGVSSIIYDVKGRIVNKHLGKRALDNGVAVYLKKKGVN